MDELQEAIQTSLDILVEQHERILEKSKIEIFSDEPLVKELVRDIAVARDSVLVVAKILDDSIALEEN
jgi:DNA polymerase III psi subunit